MKDSISKICSRIWLPNPPTDRVTSGMHRLMRLKFVSAFQHKSFASLYRLMTRLQSPTYRQDNAPLESVLGVYELIATPTHAADKKIAVPWNLPTMNTAISNQPLNQTNLHRLGHPLAL